LIRRRAVWWLALLGVLLVAGAHLSSAPITRRAIKGTELTWDELDANFTYMDQLSPVVVTLSAFPSGSITVNGPGIYQVETFGGNSTGAITSILGGLGHEEPIILRLNTSGRVITVTHTAPNLVLQNSADFLLNSPNDSLELRSRTSSIWTEMKRASVP
jgi:hypothetical protein